MEQPEQVIEQPVEVTPVAEKDQEVDKPLVTIEETEEELPADLDKIFALKPEVFEAAPETEEEEESDSSKKAGGKKKKKKHVEIEYDPERDMVMVHKKHKRGGGEWGDW